LGVIPDAQDIGYGIGEAGDHYYLANVEVTYLGERSKQHYYTLKYGLLGATNVLNKQEPSDGRSSTNLCYRPHEPVLSLSAELFGDGTIQGVLCYGITTADADLPEQVLVVVFGDTSVYPPEEPELFFLSLDPNRDDSSTARSGKSLSNPTPFGEAVQIGDWRIKVLAPPSDETDGSSSNVSTYLKGGLPEGWRMNGIEMSFTYVGATSSTLDQSKMELGVVAGAGTLYSSILTQLWYESKECGGGPLRLYGNTRLVENTTVRGYLCFKTTAEEVADGGLVLVVDEWGPNSERAFMALE